VIGVVTTSYPRFTDDGAGGFVRERVRALQRAGHQVEILAAGDFEGSVGVEPTVTRICGGRLFYTGGAPEALESGRLERRMCAWAQASCFTARLLSEVARRRHAWSAVESHWLVPCGVVVAAMLPDTPHRAHVHGGDLHLLARLPWADSLARALCSTKPRLVFASRSLRDRFQALLGVAPESLGAESLIEPAPIDASLFYPREESVRQRLRNELGLSGPTLLGAGRLVAIKGFDVLIAALATIPTPERPRCVLAGEGPDRRSLEHHARRLGVDVEFLGSLGQRALADWMVAADLFVHPCRALPNGRSEGMPLVVREALACGVPVVASSSGGVGEMRGTRRLSLVEPEDVQALAHALACALRGAI
jgi:glycosyltransferase involved in cell wall biosynthesis